MHKLNRTIAILVLLAVSMLSYAQKGPEVSQESFGRNIYNVKEYANTLTKAGILDYLHRKYTLDEEYDEIPQSDLNSYVTYKYKGRILEEYSFTINGGIRFIYPSLYTKLEYMKGSDPNNLKPGTPQVAFISTVSDRLYAGDYFNSNFGMYMVGNDASGNPDAIKPGDKDLNGVKVGVKKMELTGVTVKYYKKGIPANS